MRRRDFLAAGFTLPVLAGCDLSLEQGLFNSCLSATPEALKKHKLIEAAWQGLQADRVWDTHTHLFGNGRSKTGVWENQDTEIGTKVRRVLYVNASCAGGDNVGLDAGMVQRLAHLVGEMREGAKVMVLAFDATYDAATRTRVEKQSVFSVSNEYAARVAQESKERKARFEWIASIHPYRPDALDELSKAKANGAKAVKWLPSVMGIDFRLDHTRRFFAEMKRLDIPLLTHVGEEKALHGAERHDLNNPQFLRVPLNDGVRVIAAHCASLGQSEILDANFTPTKGGKKRDFDLFADLMKEREYEGLLFGDLSAVTQANRAVALHAIMTNTDWHHRLLNGSDYPLPGVMPIFSLSAYVREGLLSEDEAKVLGELRESNSLYFDFVLKRTLRYQGKKLPNAVFETRPFFERTA